MPDLFGDVFPVVEGALRFRKARQGLLASNVANADTPGYRRTDLTFDARLARASASVRRTDPRHLAAAPGGEPGWRMVRGGPALRPDGNNVNLEREVVRLSRNASAFTQQANVLSRLVTMTRLAITGEPR